MISIVDYGVGNLKSLQNALQFLGFESQFINSPHEVLRAEMLILPGVGAFKFAMDNIRTLNLESALLEKAKSGTPIMGICLGMQLFFTRSQEGGSHSGLDLISGQVVKIDGTLKVPHMGWNEIQIQWHRPSRLTRNLPSTRYGYFVHSYYCKPEDMNSVVATTEYGRWFAAVFEKDNIFGVQFHPEKSQELGLQILRNFAEL